MYLPRSKTETLFFLLVFPFYLYIDLIFSQAIISARDKTAATF